MNPIEVPAIRFNQDGVTLFVTAMAGKDINDAGVVHKWDPDLPDDHPDQGYQRSEVSAHVKRIAKFLLETDKHKRLMPTAVLLSSRRALEFRPLELDGQESQLGILKIEHPVYKVDGQHRSLGLSVAAETNEELLGFRLPVVLLQDIEKEEEVRQFHTVNHTPKRVRTDLADRLLRALGEFDTAATGWRKKALEVVDTLVKDKDGPWESRIKLPNGTTGYASQRTWTESLKPVFDGVLKNAPTAQVTQAISNFWSALRELMPEAFEEPDMYVLQKSVGVFAMHRVAAHVFINCMTEGSKFTIAKQKEILESAGEYVTSEYWLNTANGGRAPMYQGMSGFAQLADEITSELPEAKIVINV